MIVVYTFLCMYCAENCIDGIEFLLLKDEEVKKMVPPIGIAKKIIRLIPRPAVMLNLPHLHNLPYYIVVQCFILIL